jgi:V/A-type H+-transporting ATPase subunit E
MAVANDRATENGQRASGVQELIDRLRDDGVAQGRAEGEALVSSAREEAARLLDAANREADAIRSSARVDAEKLRRDGAQALKLAARDGVIALREALRDDFAGRLKKLVSHSLRDRSFLERLILEIASKSAPADAGRMELLLPDDVVSFEELQKAPSEASEGSLSRFVLDLSAEVLREGLTFRPADDAQPGVRVRLKEQDVEIDLTDEALTELLMDHLAPRFRALLEDSAA